MASPDSFSGVQTLLESYLDAFERLDADSIADHFAYPSHIASDAAEIALIPIKDRQDCIAAVSKVITMHRQLGMPSGSILDLSVTELSPRLAQASLRMQVRGIAAKPLYEFDANYTLAKFDAGWLIAAISHNQIPRLQACLARN